MVVAVEDGAAAEAAAAVVDGVAAVVAAAVVRAHFHQEF